MIYNKKIIYTGYKTKHYTPIIIVIAKDHNAKARSFPSASIYINIYLIFIHIFIIKLRIPDLWGYRYPAKLYPV